MELYTLYNLYKIQNYHLCTQLVNDIEHRKCKHQAWQLSQSKMLGSNYTYIILYYITLLLFSLLCTSKQTQN